MPTWDEILKGTSGNDVINGGAGDDYLQGKAGDDILRGEQGNDQLHGDADTDYLVGGEGDDTVDGGGGIDTAVYSGSVKDYTFTIQGGNYYLSHTGGTRADGNDWLLHVERLMFSDAIIDLTQNNAPIAYDDVAFTNEDVGTYSSGAAGVLANDFDWEHQSLSVTPGTLNGTFGTLTLNANGTYTYTPYASAQALAQGETVQDSFSYTVSDGTLTDTGTLTVTLSGVNDAPVANPDTATGHENEMLSIDVLANDTDIDNGATRTVIAASVPAGRGSVAIVGNQVQFDPGTDFDYLAVGQSEAVVIDYTIADEHGATSSSTVNVTVTGTNDAPVAGADSASTSENASILVDVLANDTDVDNNAVLTVTSASAPAGQGSAAVVGNQVEFDPGGDFDHLAAGASATVVVSYSIEDEHGASAASTINIIVTGTNDGPVANPDNATTSENAAVLIDVAANDTDADDGAVLTVTAASAPSGQGSASIVGNQVRFDPGSDFDHLAVGASTTVVVSYTIEDEHGASSSSTANVTVTGTNDGPVANPDSATTSENAAVLIDVVANDTDVDDGAVLTVTAASAPSGQGSASVVGNQVRFDPGSDFDHLAVGATATVVVSYSIRDEHGATSSSAVTVSVTGTNDGPVANPDTAATSENSAVLIDVTANDTDADDNAVLTVTAASAPAGQGSASIVGNQVRFDPGSDFDHLAVGITATVVVSYTVEDEHGASSSSSVAVTVTGTNDGPVANPDTATTSENSGLVVDVLANDDDADDDAVLTVTAASVPAGQGAVTIVENQVRFDPGTDFDYLADGESAQVVVNYTIEDEFGAEASSTVTITVEGRDEGTANTGTDEGETLTGTSGDDVINALGGDDTVFGLAGDDQLDGGADRDILDGADGDDVIAGGTGDDFASGGDGEDQLSGQAGNDNMSGGNDDDQLLGGDGFDVLNGDAGNDIVDGGNDDDFLSGGEGDDQLSGQAGDDQQSGDLGNDQLSGGDGRDGLDGGEGNDSMAGGAGDDFLSDFAGVNSFAGGLGDDQVLAGSAGGVQTIDGGGGNDTIRHYYRYAASSITTGTGSDTIILLNADQYSDPDTAIVVTDFTTGAGGDMVGIGGEDGSLLSLLSGWDGSANPFGAGFLRLVQNGADTVLEWDQDGSAGGSDWHPVMVFRNTNAVDFTDANFAPGYHPDGSAPDGQTINGTAEGDTLNGTIGDDTINALAGDDIASGGAGGDAINGGDGDDFLNGQADNDVIAGGNDDDYLSGGGGNDQLSGQAGNDQLVGDDGDDTLAGGIGNDGLDGGAGNNSLDGGDGDDFLTGGLGTDVLTGGAGNDTIRHFGRNFAGTITTGAGSDTIELLNANAFSDPATVITVTDFTTGAGGDMFRLDGGEGSLLSLLSGWDGSSNPFGSGFLRLTQSGPDTLLQWDQDGATGGANWQTLVVFQNRTATSFTDDNFAPAYGPDGAAPDGQAITGTADSDTLIGTIGGDTIDSLAGDDTVSAGAGADIVHGGDGFDLLSGEADNDVIEGGNNDDYLSGGDGDDTLSGQAGNDQLFGDQGDDTLSGGIGNDGLDGGEGNNSLTGGDGDDFLTGGLGTDVLNGGAGNDTIRHYNRNFAGTITTGTGSDTIELLNASVYSDPATVITVTDFTTGAGGDLFSIGGEEGSLLSLLSGWDGSSNPFSAGFLRLTQSGSDTLLQWDQDGATGGANWQTLVVFQNRTATSFTDANFSPSYDPDGTAPAGEAITGTAGADKLAGTIGDDTITALGGDDYVSGGAGGDQIDGGDGQDMLIGEADNDVVAGGTGDDYLFGREGDDQLSGQADNDQLLGEAGDDSLSGGDGKDGLDGGDGEDTLTGGAGDDFLTGGAGSDVLTGGLGADTFFFQRPSDGPDEVSDFVSGTDQIAVSSSDFGGGLFPGSAVSLVSGADPTATETGGQFLYDTDDGRLLWDADGTGSDAAVLVATFTNVPPLTATDFVVF